MKDRTKSKIPLDGIIAFILGLVLVIYSWIKYENMVNDYYLWGLTVLLFSLHLFNSREIKRLEDKINYARRR